MQRTESSPWPVRQAVYRQTYRSPSKGTLRPCQSSLRCPLNNHPSFPTPLSPFATRRISAGPSRPRRRKPVSTPMNTGSPKQSLPRTSQGCSGCAGILVSPPRAGRMNLPLVLRIARGVRTGDVGTRICRRQHLWSGKRQGSSRADELQPRSLAADGERRARKTRSGVRCSDTTSGEKRAPPLCSGLHHRRKLTEDSCGCRKSFGHE
jgi:hypothetical protein